MSVTSSVIWRLGAALVLTLALALVLSSAAFTYAAGGVTKLQLSHDPYTNTTSQHHTQVEPDTYSNGSTIVAVIQSGRFFDGGSSNIGWATSTNNGATWNHGFLPGTTVYATPAGPYARVSDPSVAYDAKHNTWIIASLALQVSGGAPFGAAVIINQSTDGGLTWTNPVVVKSTTTGFFDKDWIVCDDTSSSPFYGHCYVEWDDANNGNSMLMSTSTNGGNTWGAPIHPSGANGLGGQPVVQPNGTTIVPFESLSGTIAAYQSTNGGNSWGSTVNVATINVFIENANIRTSPLPSAEIDGAGKVFVAWQDCRFESNCSANDIVFSTSSNGTTWSAVQRIPADPIGSGVDHFIPGIAVDKSTSGSSAHLALAFYYFPVASCTTNCMLNVGFVSSADGGSTWTSTQQIAGPMNLNWIASTNQGNMVGDYISTSFSGGKAYPVFALAKAPTGNTFHEGMYTIAGGLAALGGTNVASSSGAASVYSAVSVRHTAF